jgi:hypothetical protein
LAFSFKRSQLKGSEFDGILIGDKKACSAVFQKIILLQIIPNGINAELPLE